MQIKLKKTIGILMKPELSALVAQGLKTQTRRLKPYKVGDLLYVKETFYHSGQYLNGKFIKDTQSPIIGYLGEFGDLSNPMFKKYPSIFMPRYASRHLLEVTAVRKENLWDISLADCEREGVCHTFFANTHPLSQRLFGTVHRAFEDMWECINGEGSFHENPLVYVIDFKKI